MNIHSVAPSALPTRKNRPDPAPGAKRDAILRAAIDVFADRGFFNAQVADVARAAGVAAGTVYLYFRGKDDLLVSIFERTMREALARVRASIAETTDPAERLRRFARLQAQVDVLLHAVADDRFGGVRRRARDLARRPPRAGHKRAARRAN